MIEAWLIALLLAAAEPPGPPLVTPAPPTRPPFILLPQHLRSLDPSPVEVLVGRVRMRVPGSEFPSAGRDKLFKEKMVSFMFLWPTMEPHSLDNRAIFADRSNPDRMEVSIWDHSDRGARSDFSPYARDFERTDQILHGLMVYAPTPKSRHHDTIHLVKEAQDGTIELDYRCMSSDSSLKGLCVAQRLSRRTLLLKINYKFYLPHLPIWREIDDRVEAMVDGFIVEIKE